METCVVICRRSKPQNRHKKVLFINAVNEVTRERARSFLIDRHIEHILNAYRSFEDEEGFAKVVELATIQEKGNNLSIPLYIQPQNGNGSSESKETVTLEQAIVDWQKSSQALRSSMRDLFVVLEKGRDEVVSHD